VLTNGVSIPRPHNVWSTLLAVGTTQHVAAQYLRRAPQQGKPLEEDDSNPEAMLSLMDELRKTKGLKNKRIKNLNDMLEEWEQLLPALPDDPHDIAQLRATVENLHQDHFVQVQGWLEEMNGARLARARLYVKKFDDMWARFPASTRDTDTVDHRAKCRETLLRAESKTLKASDWAFVEVELTDMRYLLTPSIGELVGQVKELCEVRCRPGSSILRGMVMNESRQLELHQRERSSRRRRHRAHD
jgi:hypothetical protein